LKRSAEKNKLDHFDFIEINGMKLSEPRQAYVQILKQLSGQILTWEQAYNALEKRFNSRTKKPMTLLLVDEVCNYISIYFLFLVAVFKLIDIYFIVLILCFLFLLFIYVIYFFFI